MTEKDRHNGESVKLNTVKSDDEPILPYQLPRLYHSPRLVKLGDLRTITLAPTLGGVPESGFDLPADWI